MALSLDYLNYPTLLAGNDKDALVSALSTVLVTDLTVLLANRYTTMGLPTVPDANSPLVTEVPLTSTDPRQPQPEAIQYLRLDLGDYMDCCLRYVSQADAADAVALAAWFQSVHGLWFDPTLLTLGSITPDPNRTDRSTLTVSVDASNYVWTGSATLYVVPANHLALLAYDGVATGIRPTDVGAVA